MRILLVKPSPRLGTIRGIQSFRFLEPLELGYLAAAAPIGHDIRVADLRRAQFPEHSFRCTLRRFRPDLVGFTGYTHEVSAIRRLARLTREDCPAARVVVGGRHATVAPADILRAFVASRRYAHGYQKLHEDYPRELWGQA